jgi:hypothetical protein
MPFQDFYIWGAAATGMVTPTGGIAEIGPGYDERGLGRPTQVWTDRVGGAFYRDAWKAAVGSGKKWVAIETWNEFHEASDVAESVEYGRSYLELTKQYVGAWKNPPIVSGGTGGGSVTGGTGKNKRRYTGFRNPDLKRL